MAASGNTSGYDLKHSGHFAGDEMNSVMHMDIAGTPVGLRSVLSFASFRFASCRDKETFGVRYLYTGVRSGAGFSVGV